LQGADLNAADKYGCGALHLAALHGGVEAVEWLVEHGADVEAVDNEGRTALAFAIQMGHDAVVAVLTKRVSRGRPVPQHILDALKSQEGGAAATLKSQEGGAAATLKSQEGGAAATLKSEEGGAAATLKSQEGGAAATLALAENKTEVAALVDAKKTYPSDIPDSILELYSAEGTAGLNRRVHSIRASMGMEDKSAAVTGGAGAGSAKKTKKKNRKKKGKQKEQEKIEERRQAEGQAQEKEEAEKRRAGEAEKKRRAREAVLDAKESSIKLRIAEKKEAAAEYMARLLAEKKEVADEKAMVIAEKKEISEEMARVVAEKKEKATEMLIDGLKSNDITAMERAVGASASVTAPANGQGWTPLHFAAAGFGNVQSMQWLVEQVQHATIHYTTHHTLHTIHYTPYTTHHTLHTIHYTPYTTLTLWMCWIRKNSKTCARNSEGTQTCPSKNGINYRTRYTGGFAVRRQLVQARSNRRLVNPLHSPPATGDLRLAELVQQQFPPFPTNCYKQQRYEAWIQRGGEH
jgi:hypothetical protein